MPAAASKVVDPVTENVSHLINIRSVSQESLYPLRALTLSSSINAVREVWTPSVQPIPVQLLPLSSTEMRKSIVSSSQTMWSSIREIWKRLRMVTQSPMTFLPMIIFRTHSLTVKLLPPLLRSLNATYSLTVLFFRRTSSTQRVTWPASWMSQLAARMLVV